MFKTVGQFEGFLFIQSEDECLIFSAGTAERARKRFERKAYIRKPMTAKIDCQYFLFTLNEWERGQAYALAFQIRFSQCDIFKVYRWENTDRHKNRLRQQKMISLRAIMNANAAALEQEFKRL